VTITKVVLENFKSHSRTEIPLRPLTVLVGPNSVGKTSVLEAIEWIVGPATSNEIAFLASDPSERRKLRFGASEMVLQVDGPIASESQLWLGIARDDAGEYSQTRSWKNKGAKGSRTALSSEVQDLDAEIARYRAAGIEMPDAAPSLLPNARMSAVPASAAFGMAIQLISYTR